MAAALFILYCCFNFIKGDLFFPSSLILWISIYFVIAYIRLYLSDFSESLKSNVFMLCIGLGGYVGIAVVTNIIGLRWASLQNSMLMWATNCNPFIIMSSIALLNLMRNLTFTNKVINYISSLSMVIYIIHENLILRTYYRPAIWNYIYLNYGYDRVVGWVLLLSLFVFAFGFISSVIYDKTLRPYVNKVGDKIYARIRKRYLALENRLLLLR